MLYFRLLTIFTLISLITTYIPINDCDNNIKAKHKHMHIFPMTRDFLFPYFSTNKVIGKLHSIQNNRISESNKRICELESFLFVIRKQIQLHKRIKNH